MLKMAMIYLTFLWNESFRENKLVMTWDMHFSCFLPLSFILGLDMINRFQNGL